MSDLGFSLLGYPLRRLITVVVLLGGVQFPCLLAGEEIEFATKDGQHTTRGTISSFLNANGDETLLPRSLTPDTQVVIKRLDGTETPPIKLSALSEKTRKAITDFVVKARRAEPGPDIETEKASIVFRQHQQQLIDFATELARLGPMDQVPSFEKEQYLAELREYKNELQREAASDWAVRFTLAYLEGEYGENKYGEIYLIAKESRDFWIAWQSAIIFSLRYRENISDTLKLMDQYLTELTDFRKRDADAPNLLTLEKAGHAALWLRETAKLLESSGLATDTELKRLKQIQISTTLKTLIKNSKIPDAVLDAAENRRREIEKERRDAEAEANRIKQLALDKRIRECSDILNRFIQSYDNQWESGTEAFDRQRVIANEASQNLREAEERLRDSRQSHFEWSLIASRDLGEDPTDAEIRYQQHAQDRANFYLREENRAAFEARQRQFVFNTERRKLTQAHATLADFVNRGKNQMILFENHHLDTIKADAKLKQIYLEFTDKIKAVVAQLPPMPTIMPPRKNQAKLEAKTRGQELREKTNELSFSLTVDLKHFLEQLAAN